MMQNCRSAVLAITIPQLNKNDAPKISKYAFGADYHTVIKKKLKELQFFITDNFGEINVEDLGFSPYNG